MHTEVFNNIDTLISMANSTMSIDEINSELITLKKQIKNKRNDIEDLETLMTESRYFNASNELVDKNIEISLKNKISRLNRKIKDVKNSLDEIKSRENTIHESITSLNEKLSINKSYIEKLKTKAQSGSDNNYYANLLESEEKNELLLIKELEEKTNNYNDILKELESNSETYNELSNNLDVEKSRLNDILDNLENKSAYIDEDLKHNDEAKLETLKEDLAALEKRKLELLSDASIIGADAKELIIDNNIVEALNKIKELVRLVKKEPYMDINSSTILEEELEKKESLRVELSTLIDNKNYEEMSNSSVTTRIDYLNNELGENKKSIDTYQAEINSIDAFVNDNLGNAINNLESEILKLEKSIGKSHNLLKEKKNSPRNKASIENDLSKKEKEKSILNDILSSYKEDLLAKIERTNILSNLITELKEANAKYAHELENLKKLSMLDLKTKDYAEEEQDKEELKKLTEEIKAIKNRQKFDKTPDEIYDQIDMALAAIMPMTPEEPNNSLEIDNLFETKPIEPKTHDPERLKVIEMIPVETVKQDSTTEVGGN